MKYYKKICKYIIGLSFLSLVCSQTADLSMVLDLKAPGYLSNNIFETVDNLWKVTINNNTGESYECRIFYKLYSNDYITQGLTKIISIPVSGKVFDNSDPEFNESYLEKWEGQDFKNAITNNNGDLPTGEYTLFVALVKSETTDFIENEQDNRIISYGGDTLEFLANDNFSAQLDKSGNSYYFLIISTK